MYGLIFEIRSGLYVISSWCSAGVTDYAKQKLSLRFLGLTVAFFFCIHSGDGMYDLPLFNCIVWNYIRVRSIQSNT